MKTTLPSWWQTGGPPQWRAGWLGHRWLLAAAGMVWLATGPVVAQDKASKKAQKTVSQATDKLRELDDMLRQPLRNILVTDDAYAATLYQKQVSLSGLAVRQGRTLGTNLTVDEKSVVVNLGLPNIELAPLPSLAVIATGRFTPEDGFVKLLADDKLKKNFNYGGTLLFFGDGGSRYTERTRKDFHWRLLQLRRADQRRWAGPLTPCDTSQLKEKYAPIAARFIRAWRNFQHWLDKAPQYPPAHSLADRFYAENGNLTPQELQDVEGELRYLRYLDAEHRLRPLLPADWDSAPRAEESRFVHQQLQLIPARPALRADTTLAALIDSLRSSHQFSHTLERGCLLANADTLAARTRFYDSLQQHIPWALKVRWWLTGTVLHNTLEQAVFNAANKAQTYADVYQDNFWQLQGAGNFLREGSTLNTYLSVGAGTNDGRVFKKSDLRTYQTEAWQRTTTDSALVVTQKNLYPALPERIRYLTLQTQLTFTLARSLPGFGITATYDTQLAANQHALHNLTLGLILPVRALKSTLLFIPLVRARSADLPDRWSAGFSVTASIPGLSK